ncbi:roundabout homolog 3-like [Poecilia formosa]|uniref:roundabout homolog 3-like n=1 Tax=Poecilia formosa TaxID=48698 RepID=UPI0007B8D052|nr:PREDICTED: roundabout homolog 3-like [Poecilia formosa]
MSLLGALFIFVLQFEASVCGISRAEIYHPLGEDVVLLCRLPQSDPHVGVKWHHDGETLVSNGTMMDASSRGGRLSVNIYGSLIIKKVTASDAGVYTCQFPNSISVLDNVLCLLSISPSPPDECKEDQIVDLSCSLSTDSFSSLGDRIVWLNETGNVLQTNRVGLKRKVSVLTVKCQMGNYRRYTCQFVQKNDVKAEVHYTSVFSDNVGFKVDDVSFHGRGEDVVLSCPLFQPDPHVGVNWSRGRNPLSLVENGTVMEASSPSGRLSVSREGSVVLRKVTTSDAGHYRCWFQNHIDVMNTVLCVLSISPSPPDAECKNYQIVDLSCSLMCIDLSSCPEGSIVWLNETGNVLQEKKVGLEGDTGCVSVLTVNRLMGNYRRYSCRFVRQGQVKMEVHYTPVFSDSTDWPVLNSVLLILRVAGLILMICVVVVVYIRTRGSKKPPKDINVRFAAEAAL